MATRIALLLSVQGPRSTEDYETLAHALRDFSVSDGHPLWVYVTQDGPNKNLRLKATDLGTCESLEADVEDLNVLVSDLNGDSRGILAYDSDYHIRRVGEGTLRVFQIEINEALFNKLCPEIETY